MEKRAATLAAKEKAAADEMRRAAEALPLWKQPIYAGDDDDVRIWRLFTLLRIQMRWMVERGYPLVTAANDLKAIGGLMAQISAGGRVMDVFVRYGHALATGGSVGDDSRPPWWTEAEGSFQKRRRTAK